MGWFKVLGIALASSCAVYAVTVSNPIIWADNPDPAIVRVDDAYYMVSTTMYYAPGVPVMKSTDLAQWRTVGYAYQTLINNDEQNLNNGKSAYAKGSWASSIRYHKGYFYVLTPSYTSGKTHIYKTADVENGPWSEVQLPYMYHDPSLFFDDDGTAWVIYGSGNEIKYVELNGDASGLKQNGRSGILGGVNIDQVTGSSNYYVKQEGSHMEKIDGKYYLFTILPFSFAFFSIWKIVKSITFLLIIFPPSPIRNYFFPGVFSYPIRLRILPITNIYIPITIS